MLKNNVAINPLGGAPMRPRGEFANKAVYEAIARYHATEKGKAALKRARDKYRGIAAEKRRARTAWVKSQAAELDAHRRSIGLPPFAERVLDADGLETSINLDDLGL